MTADDQLILERARIGEESAFAQLVEMYKEKIYYLALDLTGNQADAEDCSQEVFIKAFRSLGSFRGESKLSSWLYRITYNTCMDNRRNTQFKMNEKSVVIEDQFDLPDPAVSPEESVRSQSEQKIIQTALEKLSDRERAVFVMRHYQECKLGEIADALEISEGTVKSLLFRAVRKLQKFLAPEYPELARRQHE